MAVAMAKKAAAHLDYEAVVIGAGFSGIGAAIKLKQAGIDSFAVLEREDDVGGVWRQNTYPGIAVDIASFTYSFAFEQNPDWSRIFAPGHELKQYADHCTDKYGIRAHVRTGTKVKYIQFDQRAGQWDIHIDGGETIRARYVLSATGPLSQPKWPEIPGLKQFRGKLMHPARWDHGYDLTGKRVAVIGTGATAVQLVPAIASQVANLTVFQRTPIWILPKPDRDIRPLEKLAFRYVPGAQSAARLATNAISEAIMVTGIVYYKQFPQIVRAAEASCIRNLHAQVADPDLREKLTPRYGFGCKRPSFSNDYFATFNRDNVSLVTSGIRKITPTGVVTEDGARHAVDVLITATGYMVLEKGNLPTYTVLGKGGRDLGGYWAERGYQAYEGITVPEFPNYFIISFGPYSAGGASWFSIIDAHSTHAVRCIDAARRRKAKRIEVRQAAHDQYHRAVQRRMQNTVLYNHNCATANSYYFDKSGQSPFLRPSSGLEMWWRSRRFPLRDYRFQ